MNFKHSKEELLYLFDQCIYANYTTVENSASFSLEQDGKSLYIYFEKSNGAEDWINNFDFNAAKTDDGKMSVRNITLPYKNMDDVWYCHQGFLRVWKSIEPYVREYILSPRFTKIVSVGYSHGGAIATLCHEYVWYNRRDIESEIYGYGFGAPRIIFGNPPREKQRWKNYYVIRNIDDIVTHLPPRILGYRHVGEMIHIGRHGLFSRIDAHKAENYIRSLKL